MIGTVRVLVGALLLLAPTFLLTGCNVDALRIMIPDFESSEVLGVNVYRRVRYTGDPETDWTRSSHIVFTEPFLDEDGVERMEYTVKGVMPMEKLSTVVERDAADPDRVRLHLLFGVLEKEGEVRVATFNAAGESSFSAESATL